MFVSFNDGDNWQSLQLNLPPTSMRDLAFKDNDLIVATHGRGFWMLDDISALRQIGRTSRRPTRSCSSRPRRSSCRRPTDQGTPTQKDEPWAENPPTGAIIDYYLKSARDRAGDARDPRRAAAASVAALLERRSGHAARSEHARGQRDLAARAGSAVGDGGDAPFRVGLPSDAAGGRAAAAAAVVVEAAGAAACRRSRPAAFTVKLTVNGKSYTQPLTVKPDPRER